MTRVNTAARLIRLGTRGSKLALVQTALVRDALLALDLGSDLDIRVEIITTKGDAVQDRPLSQIGGNGVFVRQIEAALLNGSIDMAVHSAKDLPSSLAVGTTIGAYLPRADARDVLVSAGGKTLANLHPGSRVGTSSPRRACQLRVLRPDLILLDIRGNVDTRLRKLREGEYDAIVLAAAGLERLGRLNEVTEWLDPAMILPAVAQGALALQVRANDPGISGLAERLNDPPTWAAVTAERAFLTRVGGSCSLPVGAHAVAHDGEIIARGMIGSPDGHIVRGEQSGRLDSPEALGTALADDLLASGGREMVEGNLREQEEQR